MRIPSLILSPGLILVSLLTLKLSSSLAWGTGPDHGFNQICPSERAQDSMAITSLLEDHRLASREAVDLRIFGSHKAPEARLFRQQESETDRELRILVSLDPPRIETIVTVGLESLSSTGKNLTGVIRGAESILRDLPTDLQCDWAIALTLQVLQTLGSPTQELELSRNLLKNPDIARLDAEIGTYSDDATTWFILSPRQKNLALWTFILTVGILLLFLRYSAMHPRIGVTAQRISLFSPLMMIREKAFLRKLRAPLQNLISQTPKKIPISSTFPQEIQKFEKATGYSLTLLLEEKGAGTWLKRTENAWRELIQKSAPPEPEIFIWISLLSREARCVEVSPQPNPALHQLIELLEEDLASTSTQHALELFLKTGQILLNPRTRSAKRAQ